MFKSYYSVSSELSEVLSELSSSEGISSVASPEISVSEISSESASSAASSGTGEAVRVPKIALPSSVPASSSFQEAPSLVRWKVAVAVMVASLFLMLSRRSSWDLLYRFCDPSITASAESR